MKYSPNRRSPAYRPQRLWVFRIIVVLTFVVLGARVFQIQFLETDEFVQLAEENRFDTVSIPATRGIILDRDGVALATNVASANVILTPAELPEDAAEELEILRQLSGLLNVPLSNDVSGDFNPLTGYEEDLVGAVRQGDAIAPYRGIPIKQDVDYDTARLLLAENLPGVSIEWQSVREYPTGPLSAHVIGYMGPIPERLADSYEDQGYVLDRDRIGYDGLEFTYNDWLAGEPGFQRVERDVAGQIIRTVGETTEPQAGHNLQLTIDMDLQRRAQERLQQEMNALQQEYPEDEIGFNRGVVIAMNPQTGEILAMVSLPTYDNREFERRIDYNYYLRVSQDPNQPLFNQAVGSLYPPGSIFKMLTATAALEEGIVEWTEEFNDPGEIQLENRYYPNDPGQSQTFVCWKGIDEGGHGPVNLVEGLAYSCDVYFYKITGGYPGEVESPGLGINGLSKWMEIFGLGSPVGVELPGDQTIGQIATIPTPDWKRRTWGENWSTGDTYNASFGQGYVLATPMQMLDTLNTLLNDGTRIRPTLIREIRNADGDVVMGFEPDVVGQIPVSMETMALMKEGMRQAVINPAEDDGNRGTAAPALEYMEGMGIEVGGKTGTAEYCDDIAARLERCIPGSWPAHAWYMGYAPYDDPEIAVIAFVYNGKEGSGHALPVAMDVIEYYFELKQQEEQEEASLIPQEGYFYLPTP